jgi:hypothetical protein
MAKNGAALYFYHFVIDNSWWFGYLIAGLRIHIKLKGEGDAS